MLEHMLFKGTTKRTEQDIATEVETIGGQLNAFTTREQTVYYMKVLKPHLRFAVEMLGDLLLNSCLEETQMNLEKRVIEGEIQQSFHDAPSRIREHFSSTVFTDQPF